MTRSLCAALGIVLLPAGAPLAGEKAPDLREWSLAVEVRWGEEGGPEAFRADAERAIASRLGQGCAAGVETGREAVLGGASDLLLIATLDGFAEELRFDDSLATAATPGEPTKELRRVAFLDVDISLHLLTREGSREVASKRFHAGVQHRPVYLGEEPQEAAREEGLYRIVQETSRMLCKSGGKLGARVRKELDAR